MQFIRLRLSVLMLVLIALCGSNLAAQSSCLPADSFSTYLSDYIKALLSSTDSATKALVQTLGLQGVKTTDVSPITSGQTCKKAADAIDQLANTPNSGRRIYVVKAGKSRYVVRDPNDSVGNALRAYILTSSFVYVKALLQ
jgi:hypothetical protein